MSLRWGQQMPSPKLRSGLPVGPGGVARSDECEHGFGKGSWLLLRNVVPGADHDTMLQVTWEVRRPLSTVGGGEHAMSPAIQGDGRDFDSRHALQLQCSVRVSGIPRHRPELVAIVVQRHFDPVWVVEGRGCALELTIAEGPTRRPLAP